MNSYFKSNGYQQYLGDLQNTIKAKEDLAIDLLRDLQKT